MGADITIKDHRGMTAIEYAKLYDSMESLDLLT